VTSKKAEPHSASPPEESRKRLETEGAGAVPRRAGGPERGLKREGESSEVLCFSAPSRPPEFLVLANAGARGEGTRPGPPRRGRWTTKFCFFKKKKRVGCWRRSKERVEVEKARQHFVHRRRWGFASSSPSSTSPALLFNMQKPFDLFSSLMQKSSAENTRKEIHDSSKTRMPCCFLFFFSDARFLLFGGALEIIPSLSPSLTCPTRMS